MIQLILHLVGDYVTQSDWMAQNKTKSNWAAFVHAMVYSLPFLAIGSVRAFLLIEVTHFWIDRFRLARYIVWAKNAVLCPLFFRGIHNDEQLAEAYSLSWENCKVTGYPSATPQWVSMWLMVIADNTVHLAVNYCALRWL